MRSRQKVMMRLTSTPVGGNKSGGGGRGPPAPDSRRNWGGLMSEDGLCSCSIIMRKV